ncbi:capsid assembly scaffolding protein Gp46 family protein [Lysinibacillus sp. NPDC097214]|uniref:capsid assembly scaffolding protein Gp46 family protein n=1 Tax=Lysinibacillus sp. NPDC097214 TaxID=3390584 RepID=UPI003D01CCAB
MNKPIKNLLDLDLQFFAEDNQTNDTNTETITDTETGTNEENEQEAKVPTMEEIQKMIQSETDKVRTEYNKKLKAKEKELETIQIEKMSEEERKVHEIEQIRQENETLKQEKLKFVAQTELAKQSLPLEATQFITGENEEEIAKNVSALKLIIDNAVTEKAGDLYRSKGTQHKQGSEKVGAMSKEEFNALSLQEKSKLYDENPSLYNQFNFKGR